MTDTRSCWHGVDCSGTGPDCAPEDVERAEDQYAKWLGGKVADRIARARPSLTEEP